jgi:hypothetical protein
VLSGLWLSLPFTIGPAVSEALADRSAAVQHVDSAGAWAIWAVGLVVTLAPSTVALTALRVLGPGALAVALLSLVGGATGGVAVVAVVVGAAAAGLSLNRVVAHRHVNGSSYGDELRFVLRTPAPLLLGPVELAVLLAVAGVLGGPMLIAADRWVAGAVAVVVGFPLTYLAARSLHGLSRRWLVFVPVGLVLHDYSTLIDSLLLQRKDIAMLEVPATDAGSLDLTGGAAGTRLRIAGSTPISVLPRPPRRPGSEGPAVEPLEVAAVLVAPVRVTAALATAAARRLPVEA